jgi:hypothetical protein
MRKGITIALVLFLAWIAWNTRSISDVFWAAILIGMVYFVGSAILDAGRAVQKGLGRDVMTLEQHNVTIEDFGQHRDPTRPRAQEDYPALLELDRQTRRRDG